MAGVDADLVLAPLLAFLAKEVIPSSQAAAAAASDPALPPAAPTIAPSSAMAAQFEAMRRKLTKYEGKNPRASGQPYQEPVGAAATAAIAAGVGGKEGLAIVDPLRSLGPSPPAAQSGSSGAAARDRQPVVVVARLPRGLPSSTWAALLADLRVRIAVARREGGGGSGGGGNRGGRSQGFVRQVNAKGRARGGSGGGGGAVPEAVCVLAYLEEMVAHGAMAAFVGSSSGGGYGGDGNRGGFFYAVVPGGGGLAWYCGCFKRPHLRAGAMRAVIDGAVKARRGGGAFAKVCKREGDTLALRCDPPPFSTPRQPLRASFFLICRRVRRNRFATCVMRVPACLLCCLRGFLGGKGLAAAAGAGGGRERGGRRFEPHGAPLQQDGPGAAGGAADGRRGLLQRHRRGAHA